MSHEFNLKGANIAFERCVWGEQPTLGCMLTKWGGKVNFKFIRLRHLFTLSLFHLAPFIASFTTFSHFSDFNSIDQLVCLYCFALQMAAPIHTGNVYVPSEDGMSDILHNAGHAYTMYLDGDKEDPNEMSLDPGTLVHSPTLELTVEIIQGVELAYGNVASSFSPTK